MKRHILFTAATVTLAALSLRPATAHAGQKEMKEVAPVPPADTWEFKLAVPGWLANTSGTFGVGKFSTNAYLGVRELVPALDMIASLSFEARKGRFGFFADYLYVSAADRVWSDSLVNKVTLQLNETLADAEVFYRVLEGPRGFLDVRAGVRFENIYTQETISPNDRAIDQASARFVNTLGSDFKTLLKKDLLRVLGGQDPVLPIPPLNADQKVKIIEIIRAAQADPELAAALKAQAQAATTALKAAAQPRVDAAKNRVQGKLASSLKRALNRSVSLNEYWFDPYIGVRGQYNLSKAWYLTAKGDIGGFGVGSEITTQLYAGLGCQVSRHCFVEAGYRYLYTDYDQNNFLYNVTQSGAQITFGVNF